MKKLVLPLVLIACLIAVATSIAGGGDAATEQQQVSPGIADVLSVFERPRVPADQVPTANADLVNSDGRPGEDRNLSRRVEFGNGAVAYLWPMRDGLCYASPGGDGCVELGRIREVGVDVGMEGAVSRETGHYESVQVFGVVRDGIAQVTLDMPSGESVEAAVQDNTFLWSGRAEAPDAVRWTDADGAHQVPLATLSPEALEAMRAE